ncbi:peptidoglycan recognition protein family protein [Leptothrix discophora]|uniref:N-acetylmuramoyl-L-alanine amidase n=1 Tax=Leptothrix discophora TaxID=89 RepID=A0ABT9FXP3_LEPDI|nr:N-acetylmuramoyl-L-alanine amidase [Leptothrix discophora]MDP4299008.1 N-acetylmuramoyl-L-alanine amidase [Leptothrix discophora]
MTFALTWMKARLLDAGLKVADVPGWESHGRGEMGFVRGVMVHHTAGPRAGNMPSLHTLVKGRSDLPGPLAQLGLGRDGTCYLVGAGRANHAGKGSWRGVESGNASFIGIEVENTGTPADLPWPAVQRDALVRAAATLLQHLGQGPEWLVGHKEYALPAGRKPDPLIDMDHLREDVAACMNRRDAETVAALVPAQEGPGIGLGRRTLRRGMKDEPGPRQPHAIKDLQSRLGLVADGDFGPRTEAAVRQWQRDRGLVPDGIVGPRSWAMLDASPSLALPARERAGAVG